MQEPDFDTFWRVQFNTAQVRIVCDQPEQVNKVILATIPSPKMAMR